MDRGRDWKAAEFKGGRARAQPTYKLLSISVSHIEEEEKRRGTLLSGTLPNGGLELGPSPLSELSTKADAPEQILEAGIGSNRVKVGVNFDARQTWKAALVGMFE